MSIRNELAQLIAQAEHEGKWLHCHYQDLWFSPAELRRANAEGHFLWGVVYWQLRDPDEHLDRLRAEAARAQRAVKEFVDRMRKAGKS